MEIFMFGIRSACAWVGVGEAGTSNPGFPGSEGLIRFIVSAPSCASSPRKSWTSLPELVRFEAAFRLACDERSALATGESRTGPSSSSNSIGASALRMCIWT